MGILEGKKVLILGVANERSIAWGIAKSAREQGASVALTYLNDAMKKRVIPLADEIGADFTCEMDVSKDEHYDKLRDVVEKEWGKFDVLVHSIAFANKEDLRGRFSDISREGFIKAFDISAFSLIGLCQSLKDLINPGGSILSMTYEGSVKVVKGYNVMGVAKAALESITRYLADDLGIDGIRVNAISAGPIRTLAASGVSGITSLTKVIEERSPLRRNITIHDVGGTAAYLASELAAGVTGQVIYVDSGVSVTTM